MATEPRITIVDGPHHRYGEWEHNRYRLRVTFQRRQLTVPWMQGMGITEDPDIGAVMASLIMEAQAIKGTRGYHDWCSDYGYDSDSGEGRSTYDACKRQTDGLERLLGRRIMVALMDDEDSTYGITERFRAAWERATR